MSFSRSSSSYSEMIARLSVYRFSRVMYVTPGRGLPELRRTVGAISDRYIGEVILQLLVEAMASHWIVPSHCPNWELNIFLSYHCHQQHIMYVSFQVLFMISDYWFIHRIPVSFGGASPYNALRWIMMLCCYTHSRLIQCNDSYMIPKYDALYDLKRQWYYEFVPFLSNQSGIDILILWGDVARRYVHQTFGLKKHAFDRGSWFQYHINCYCIGTQIETSLEVYHLKTCTTISYTGNEIFRQFSINANL